MKYLFILCTLHTIQYIQPHYNITCDIIFIPIHSIHHYIKSYIYIYIWIYFPFTCTIYNPLIFMQTYTYSVITQWHTTYSFPINVKHTDTNYLIIILHISIILFRTFIPFTQGLTTYSIQYMLPYLTVHYIPINRC